MDNADNRIMTQPEKVEHILSGSARYFGVDRKQLGEERGHKRDIDLWRRKRFIIPILFDYTATSFLDIAKLLGYKSGYRSVQYHYKEMKDEVSGELYGSQKTKMIYNELLTYLNL